MEKLTHFWDIILMSAITSTDIANSLLIWVSI